MEPKIIVMITMLTLPGGESTVHVKPFSTANQCIEAAGIEASDPFVANVECAQLDDGVLMLKFGPNQETSRKPPAAAPKTPLSKATS